MSNPLWGFQRRSVLSLPQVTQYWPLSEEGEGEKGEEEERGSGGRRKEGKRGGGGGGRGGGRGK